MFSGRIITPRTSRRCRPPFRQRGADRQPYRRDSRPSLRPRIWRVWSIVDEIGGHHQRGRPFIDVAGRLHCSMTPRFMTAILSDITMASLWSW